MRVVRTVIFALALSGCSGEPGSAPDFCNATNKTYSDREKIVETLAYVYSHIDDPQMAYYRKLPIYAAVKKAQQPEKFASAYFAEHPNCCEVHEPAIYEEWRRQGLKGSFLGEPSEWVADVAIEKQSLANPSKHRLWADFTVNNCNEVGFLQRG